MLNTSLSTDVAQLPALPGASSFKVPVAEDTFGAAPLDNSEIRKIAEDVLNAAKYTGALVFANPNREFRPDSLEGAFKLAYERLKPEKQQLYKTKATQQVELPVVARRGIFGRYGQIDGASFLAQGFDHAHIGLDTMEPLVIDKKLLGIRTPMITLPTGGIVNPTPEGLLVPKDILPRDYTAWEKDWKETLNNAGKSGLSGLDRLFEIWGPAYENDPYRANRSSGIEALAEPVTDKLALHIRRVKCVDETNPEWLGDDEIALAGVGVDEDGDTKKIAEQFIGSGFSDGIQKVYSPAWQYYRFNIREGTKWPKSYSVTLILAEKDNGGLANALNTIWMQIKDRVKQAIEAAVGAVLSEFLGSAIATAIGRAVAWVVDQLVGWIISAFQDDIFPPFIASCSIPSFSARWNYANGTWGSTTSPLRTANFYGHGGQYFVEYYWRLFA